VHPNNVLRLKSGSIVRNLSDLANELALIDDYTFQYHVNDQKHDFHDWVYHMVRDDRLAKALSAIKDRRLMLAAVEKRIQELQNPSPEKPKHWHFSAKDYLLGIIIGGIAMMMLSRLL
jgi:hypothetical protein